MTGAAGSAETDDRGDRRGVGELRVLVLGPLRVEYEGRDVHIAGTHRRRLIAFLAARGGQVATADAITDALWGDDPPPTARKSIQNHVARLRTSFVSVPREIIETTPSGYRLAVPPDAIDALAFERLAASGRRLLVAGDPGDAVAQLTSALELWRGQPYAEWSTEEFALGEVARLEELQSLALEDLCEARVQRGEPELVVADIERLLRHEPGRERAWALLVRALYGAGRQRDALAAFQRARQVLADEFGIDPGPDLRELERRVLAQDPELNVRRPPTVPAPLRRDSFAFVGRDRELEWLAQAWRAARHGAGQVRLVFGPPESGRTRLIAELATIAVADRASVVYVRGADGFARAGGLDVLELASPGSVVDAIVDRSREGALLIVVDDAEWASVDAVKATLAVAAAIERAPVMLVVVGDQSASGTAVHAVQRLDPTGALTLEVGPLSDESIAEIAGHEGVDLDGCGAVVAVARGLPGAARREAAAWAEQVAGERLARAARSSVDAAAAAAEARTIVLDEVLDVVAARTRRDELAMPAWSGRQPYRALAPYDVQDADLFVGRERVVAELAARVLERRMVAVVGASGSGKSSLVRAGLLPLVRSGRLPGSGPWRTAVIVPGERALTAIEHVDGLDEPGPLLVVVDQFEEAFLADDLVPFAARLVELAGDAALDVHVVIVLRADRYPALTLVPALAALVEDAQVLVGPPSEAELRRIVEVPARRTGCAVDSTLPALVAEDVAGRDAALPLVSAALAEVWEQRETDALTSERYVSLGGLAAAVERMGDRALARADALRVRDVILRLVDVTEDGQWVRRRIDADSVPDAMLPALDALVEARLVHRDSGELDVVHEVVFTAWPLVARWLEEVRSDLVLSRELRSTARAWEESGRNGDYHIRGARLAAATELLTRSAEVDARLADFVSASITAAEHDEVERSQHQARTNRRLRALLTGVAVLLVGALVAGGLAFRQADRADRSATKAQAASLHADARRAGDRARTTTDIDRALLLAVAGVRLHDSPETRANLLAVLSDHAGVIAPARRKLDGVVAATPDATGIVTYEQERLVRREAGDLSVMTRSEPVPPVRYFTDVEFAPDGGEVTVLHRSFDDVATDGDRRFADHPAVVYDASTLQRAPDSRQLGGVPPLSAGQDIAFSGDGRFIAISFAVFASPKDGEPRASQVLVWDRRSPAVPVLSVDPEAMFTSVAMSRTGDRLSVAVWPPGGVRTYEVATGERTALVDGVGARFVASPDGSTFAATGLNDGQVAVLEAATLGDRVRLRGNAMTAFGPPAFSHDGTRIAAPDWDAKVVYVWDVASGAIVDRLVGHTGFVEVIWFGSDDRTVEAYTSDGTLVSWDLAGGARFVARADPPPGLLPGAELVMPAPDGRVAYIAGTFASGRPESEGRIQIWQPRAGPAAVQTPIEVGPNGLTSVAWRHDGARLATSGADGTVRVWRAETGELVAERRFVAATGGPFSAGVIGGVAFTPDGTRLVVAEDAGTVYAVDAETLEPAGPRVDLGQFVLWPVTGPSDDVAAVVVTEPASEAVVLIDVTRGRPVGRLVPGFTPQWAAVAPNGDRIAVTGAGGEFQLYDLVADRWVGQAVAAHNGVALWAAWSADGGLVVTGGSDGHVGLWDGRSGASFGTLAVGADDEAATAMFVDGGPTVSMQLPSGATATWSSDPASWIDFACDVAGRDLTTEEWRDTFDDRPYRRTCS